jgi:hypothetical protein
MNDAIKNDAAARQVVQAHVRKLLQQVTIGSSTALSLYVLRRRLRADI